MNKTNDNITFKGGKLTVKGEPVREGELLPKFKLTATDMSDLTNESFKGKTLLLSVVPSLDTPVCQIQTRRFNEEAAKLSADVNILTVSLDLPFAQKRWCGAEGIERVQTASDYKYRTFGEAFGTYITDIALLARAVFIADKFGRVQYVEYVPEIAQEPDYDSALKKLRELA